MIRVQPLTVPQVTQYPATRFRDPVRHDKVHARWQPVLAWLEHEPDSPLARALSFPPRLFMAVTSYHHAATDPSELMRLASTYG